MALFLKKIETIFYIINNNKMEEDKYVYVAVRVETNAKFAWSNVIALSYSKKGIVHAIIDHLLEEEQLREYALCDNNFIIDGFKSVLNINLENYDSYDCNIYLSEENIKKVLYDIVKSYDGLNRDVFNLFESKYGVEYGMHKYDAGWEISIEKKLLAEIKP